MCAKASKIFLGSIQNTQSESETPQMLRQGDVNMLEIIVIFAHWCPTCSMMMPIVEELEADYVDKVKIIWIEADKHPEAIEQYEIQIVPTFIFMREQKEVARMAGMIGENILRERIEQDF